MDYLEKLHDAVLNGDPATAISITEKALAENIDPHVLINDYMVRAMDEVGRRFEKFEYFIPQLLMSAKAMKGAMALIKPLLVGDSVQDISVCAITGTVKGDVHDIGKNFLLAHVYGNRGNGHALHKGIPHRRKTIHHGVEILFRPHGID